MADTDIANLDELFDAADLAPAEEFDPTTDLDAEADDAGEPDADQADAPDDDALDAEDDGDDPDAEASDSGEADDSADDADEEDEDGEDADAAAELAELRRLAAEAVELKRQRDEAQRQQAEAQARAYWQQRDQHIAAQYNEARARLRQLAEQAVDPVAYYDAEIARLDAWREAESGKVRQAREQAIWAANQRQIAAQYFRQVAHAYGLSADEARELATVPLDQYEHKAARLKAQRDEIAALRARAEQAEKQIAARKIAANGVGPGRGRATSKKVKPGSREHLALLLA